MHMFYRVMKGIYQFATNLFSYIFTKYYWNRSTSDLVIAKSKRVNFFLKHSVYCLFFWLRSSVVCNKIFYKVYTLLSHTPHNTKSPLGSRGRDTRSHHSFAKCLRNSYRYGHNYYRKRIVTAPKLSNGTYFNDLERPLTPISRHDITQRQITRKWHKIELYLEWWTNRKSHMVYRTAPFSLNDP